MEQRAEILRKLMAEKNIKVSDIVKKSGLPYSTVKAILERGAEKAGYVNVCKICQAIGISADDLEKMILNTEYRPTTIAAHLDTSDLTEAEQEDIANYIEFIRNKRKKWFRFALPIFQTLFDGRWLFE